jgi:hypothetical protein
MTRLAPLWQQNSVYPALTDRALLTALWPVGTTITGHAVTTVNNTMNVSVSAGITAVPLASNAGTELCRSDAAEVVTLGTAPAGGTSRYDVICVQPRDAAVDAGGNNDWIVSVVVGTAAASPAVPAVPAGRVALANVLVPGGVVNLNTATVTDRRPLGPGAPPLYAEVTSVQGGIGGTVVDLTGLTLTFYCPGNRRYRISGQGAVQSSAAGDYVRMDVTDGTGATTYTTFQSYMPGTAAVGMNTMSVEVPAAGLVTFKLRLVRAAGTGTVSFNASTVSPGFIMVEDLGPAS